MATDAMHEELSSVPKKLVTDWSDIEDMCFSCGGGYLDVIREQIDLYKDLNHLKYLNMFIAATIYWINYFDNPQFLQTLFDKRRQIRDEATKRGRFVLPFKETKFEFQIMYDVCCLDKVIRKREYDMDSIDGEDIDFNEKIRIPTLQLILQEHKRLFPKSYRSEGFEKNKRDFISEMLWNKINIMDRPLYDSNMWEAVDNWYEECCDSDLWEMTEQIMLYQKFDSKPLLHYAVKHGYPFIIVWFISKRFPDQISQRDDEGCIPLHYSFRDSLVTKSYVLDPLQFCLQFGFYSCEDPEEKHPVHGFVAKSEYIIPYHLITKYPKGAGLVDSQGKLPLHIFLEKTRDGWMKTDDVNKESCLLFMNRLIKAEPMALATRGITSHLFPFMIPSMKEDNGYSDDDDGQDDNDCILLTMTFVMLRKNPAVLNNFIDRDRSFESFDLLKKKNRELQHKLLASHEINRKQRNEMFKLREEIARLHLQASSTVMKPINDHDGSGGGGISTTEIGPSKKRTKLAK